MQDMTNSEKLTNLISQKYFLKQYIYSDLYVKEGREEITGYALFQTNASVEVIIPSSVKSISPLPFLFNPPAQIILTFLGDAPTIVEDKDVSWIEDATVRYDPKTTGWESFAWKDKCEMQTLSQN